MGSSHLLATPTLRTHGSPSAASELRLEVALFMNTNVPHGGPPCKSPCSTKRRVYCNPRSHPDLRRARGTRHSIGGENGHNKAVYQLPMQITWQVQSNIQNRALKIKSIGKIVMKINKVRTSVDGDSKARWTHLTLKNLSNARWCQIMGFRL